MAKILVVEDDRGQLSDLLGELLAWGHEVVGAESAEEGLALSRLREFDLVLTDNILPGLTGQLAEDARLLGSRRVMAKPVNRHQLRLEVEALLGERK